MPDKVKVIVSMRAVLQRLNRRLAHDFTVLKAARGQSTTQQLGSYYRVDLMNNAITADHVDPIAWARELGLLQPWELVEGEQGDTAPVPAPAMTETPPFDPHKFRLGSLCKQGHAFQETKQSLRRLVGGTCVECARENQRKRP